MQHGAPPHEDDVRRLIETRADPVHAPPLPPAMADAGGYDETDDAAFISGLLARAEAEAADLRAAMATAGSALRLPALASLGDALCGLLVGSAQPLQVRAYTAIVH